MPLDGIEVVTLALKSQRDSNWCTPGAYGCENCSETLRAGEDSNAGQGGYVRCRAWSRTCRHRFRPTDRAVDRAEDKSRRTPAASPYRDKHLRGHLPGTIRCRVEPHFNQGGAAPRRRARTRTRRACGLSGRPAAARRAMAGSHDGPAHLVAHDDWEAPIGAWSRSARYAKEGIVLTSSGVCQQSATVQICLITSASLRGHSAPAMRSDWT
jgi:hypothetical protein